MAQFILVPLFFAWVASVLKIAYINQSFEALSSATFLWIFGGLWFGPILAVTPTWSIRLITAKSEPLLIASLFSAPIFGLGLFVLDRGSTEALLLLSGPIYQYMIIRFGIGLFRRKTGRLPAEPTAFVFSFYFPKGTPFVDRATVAGLVLVSLAPFFVLMALLV